MSKKFSVIFIIIICILYLLFIPKGRIVTLLGAGATFPYPLIEKWRVKFQESYSNITINYRAVGSGGGIRLIIEGLVDFACSDAPMNEEEYEMAIKKGTILHIPFTLGAVVLAYNIPDLNYRIKLTGEIIADIYLGKISKWNDPAIAALNSNITLPDEDIIVVKRSDSSGTTYIFTDYLSSISEEWRLRIGKTKIFSFPPEVGSRGIAQKGNQGVSQAILQIPYSIGYIELAYALQNNMSTILIKNADGFFVEANMTTIKAAAASAAAYLPKGWDFWGNVTIVNAPGKKSYPISSFSYMLVYAEQRNYEKYLALIKWLNWINTEGQDYAAELDYVPIPEEVRELNSESISRIRFSGFLIVKMCEDFLIDIRRREIYYEVR